MFVCVRAATFGIRNHAGASVGWTYRGAKARRVRNSESEKMNSEKDVDDLAAKLLDAKRIEDDAKLARINAELQLIDICGSKAEGLMTVSTEKFRVETKAVISRTIDKKAFDELMDQVGDDVRSMISTAVSWKPSLRLSEYRALRDQYPDARAELDRVITSRQGKTQVSVRGISQG